MQIMYNMLTINDYDAGLYFSQSLLCIQLHMQTIVLIPDTTGHT